MTATDELRRLLDERGVEWRDDSSIYGTRRTVWTTDGVTYVVAEVSGRLKASGYLTPQQAIAATLGRGECEVEGYDDGVDDGMDGEWYSYGPPTWYLSCGHECEGSARPRFCPVCGRRVVEVEE